MTNSFKEALASNGIGTYEDFYKKESIDLIDDNPVSSVLEGLGMLNGAMQLGFCDIDFLRFYQEKLASAESNLTKNQKQAIEQLRKRRNPLIK